ncbi:hypothetical protein PybrP1_012275 [[Pythium] brassicae (nom. inval.)]|nr:hypothetical protein PybrP1_012275 [[Pythium] brassicae (nom. inval.)]
MEHPDIQDSHGEIVPVPLKVAVRVRVRMSETSEVTRRISKLSLFASQIQQKSHCEVSVAICEENVAICNCRFSSRFGCCLNQQSTRHLAAKTMACKGCTDCAALRSELAQLRVVSQQQARRDHEQCALMYQQLQQLVTLNASLVQRCGVASAKSPVEAHVNTARGQRPANEPRSCATRRLSAAHEQHTNDRERDRLQALVVRQTKEIDELRAKLSSSIAIPAGCRVQASGLIFDATGMGDSNHDETCGGMLLNRGCDTTLEDANDEMFDTNRAGGDSTDLLRVMSQQGVRTSVHSRQLPLTSLHAQLKRRDAEIRRLRQLASKLEEHASAVVARKQEVARDYQQITRVQQQQLKKYFALLRRLGGEKRALEGKLAALDAYVAVLEKKLVRAAAEDEATVESDDLERSSGNVQSRVSGGGKSAAPTRLVEWDASVKPTATMRRAQAPRDSRQRSAASFILNVCAG